MGRRIYGSRNVFAKSNASLMLDGTIFKHKSNKMIDMATKPSVESYGKPIENWAVGITIAPRQIENYTHTIDSFLDAGWNSIHMFVEPDVKVADKHKHLPLTQRKTKLGAWKNWLTSLNDLIEFYPNADCYGLIQDDIIFCRGAKKFLEYTLWPAQDVGVCSVFTPSHYTRENPGWYKTNKKGKLWMAQTYFFPPDSARNCATHPICVDWTKEKQIDNVVGRWADYSEQYPYYFSPSLVQHVGDTSTLWGSRNRAKGRRAATDFVGECFDAHEFAMHGYKD